jgi:hypothetical protein
MFLKTHFRLELLRYYFGSLKNYFGLHLRLLRFTVEEDYFDFVLGLPLMKAPLSMNRMGQLSDQGINRRLTE